jgi:hypothetical protein
LIVINKQTKPKQDKSIIGIEINGVSNFPSKNEYRYLNTNNNATQMIIDDPPKTHFMPVCCIFLNNPNNKYPLTIIKYAPKILKKSIINGLLDCPTMKQIEQDKIPVSRSIVLYCIVIFRIAKNINSAKNKVNKNQTAPLPVINNCIISECKRSPVSLWVAKRTDSFKKLLNTENQIYGIINARNLLRIKSEKFISYFSGKCAKSNPDTIKNIGT